MEMSGPDRYRREKFRLRLLEFNLELDWSVVEGADKAATHRTSKEVADSNSNAVAKGFRKHHGMALEFVYRAENRCKSSGAPASAFPRPAPRGSVGREAAQNH